jgi:NADH dehydrogenase/NADH:ubiquinone oxidoreductase subunit G
LNDVTDEVSTQAVDEENMTEIIQVNVDGKDVELAEGTTLLDAAQATGSTVPVLCYSPSTTANGLCRLCVVETEGERGMQAACVSHAQDGAVVHTRSENVDRVRRTILEMLASTVDLTESPELQEMLTEYAADPERFLDAVQRQPEIIDDNPMFVRDYAKCVLCWRCVQVCAEDAQYTFAINFAGRGFDSSIATFFHYPIPATTCVFCGQCVGTCPTGALKGKREFLLEQGLPPEEIFKVRRKQSKP